MPFQPGHTLRQGIGKTGGRHAGTPNKTTSKKRRRLELEEAAQKEALVRMEIAKLASPEEIEAAIAEMGAMTPLEILLTAAALKLRRGDIDGAVLVAEKAAPYSHARLNATDVRVQITNRSDAEVAAEITALRAKIAQAHPAAPLQIEASAEPVEPAPASG